MSAHYNPANDPEVINGIQEAYGFKIGDMTETEKAKENY
jgi:hypothetical protein